MALQEGQKNLQKLDNSLKVAQADLDDMNNMKRVVDEKERIHNEKMKGLENENKQLDEEVGELKQLLAAKKKTLNNLKKRNEQSRNHKKKLIEIQQKEGNFDKASNRSGLDALNETDEINVQKNKSSKKNNQNSENQTNNRRKKKKETGCECLIS